VRDVEQQVSQPDLFTRQPAFDGSTFNVAVDGDRLTCQLATVKAYLEQASWVTLAEIREATGVPEASASARIRDLRKVKFGAFTVDRRRRSAGQYEYRLVKA
jgi:hypothetical protein